MGLFGFLVGGACFINGFAGLALLLVFLLFRLLVFGWVWVWCCFICLFLVELTNILEIASIFRLRSVKISDSVLIFWV